MANKLTTKNGITARQNGLVYNSPAHIPHIALGDISSTVEVCIYGMPTNFTFKKSNVPLCQFTTAPITISGSVCGIDIDNSATFHQGFILNETLQLPESPHMHPSIVPAIFSDVGQIFHNNNVSFLQAINNALGNVVVSPSHEPSPTSRHSLQLSLGSSCAFGLQPAYEKIMLDSFILDTTKEFGVRSNSEIVNSDINAENSFMRVRANCINVGRESEQEEAFAFTVNSQEAFIYFPSKIPFVTIWNSKRNLNSALDSRKAKNIILHGNRTGKVISDTTKFNSGLSFGSFHHPTGLLNASDRELALQTNVPQIEIDKGMQFDIICNSHLPCFIYAELQSSFIQFNSFNYLRSLNNSNFGCCPNSHPNIFIPSLKNLSEVGNSSPPFQTESPCQRR
jgi:hypothetical protein